jgi:hypothetical protein
MTEKYPYTKEDVLGVDHLSAKQKEDIADDWNKSHLEAEAVKYSENRQKQYPAISEQLDLLFHDMTAGKGSKTGEWYKAVKKVKDDNPK